MYVQRQPTARDEISAHWLSWISNEVRLRFLALAPPAIVPPDTVLMIEGEPSQWVLLVESGLTAITKRGPADEEVFMTFRGAGELVGEIGVLEDRPRSATVLALGGSLVDPLRVRKYHEQTFLDFLARYPEADQAVRRAMICRHLADNDQSVRYHQGSALNRVARVLLDHLDEFARPAAGGDLIIAAPLTQERIAHLIGYGKRAVQGALGELRDRGAVTVTAGRFSAIRVHHRAAVWSAANEESRARDGN